MENAKRFLARLRHDSTCASSHDSHANQRKRKHEMRPILQEHRNMAQQSSSQYNLTPPLGDSTFDSSAALDIDVPLDDFDKQLLAEGSRDQQSQYQSTRTRISLPPKPHTPLMTSSPRKLLQGQEGCLTSRTGGLINDPDDLHNNRMPQLSSSPPAQSITSPTVSALQSRQQDRNKLSRGTNTGPRLQASVKQRDIPGQKVGIPFNSSLRTSSSSSPPVIQGVRLVPATVLPDQLRSVFKFEVFNAVQSKCFATTFKTDDNLVVAAPTGSGKTVIMELAICRLVAESQGRDFKVVYQAPTKSLCSERHQDWQTKFGVLNLQCAELTGDTDYNHLRDVQSANIIITTPEKWDSVTRKWKDHARLLQLVKLFLVDEVHILKESRGATLEAVVSRMKSVSSNIRFVALSATVPNSEDIACWLGKNSLEQSMPAYREVFGESFRPVQLKKHVYGYELRGNDFAFESMLTQQIPDVISRHGQGKPVMVFCSTRRASVTTAKVLAEAWSKLHPSERRWKGPDRALSVASLDLKLTCAAGVAFHHGGLGLPDRRAIEQAFLNGQISVICSTSTLAVGVNLPCYLVILKGTTTWTDKGFQEYADLEVMQMLGRAGRPQFETSACAVILTRQEKVPRYEKMVSGEAVLESCLHQNLIEHLNAEVGLGSVYNLETAKQWLSSTFLNVRLKKNPSYYQFREGVEGAEATEDDLLEQLCEKDIALLQDAGLVSHGARLNPTEFGKAMARYYISFETMKSFIGLPPKAKTSEILSVLAQAREFRDVRMLAGEKSFYKEINKAPEIKFPIKVDVALPAHKISLLIQSELGSVALPDGDNYRKHHAQYRFDKHTVFNHIKRLICCIVDCQTQIEDSVSTRHALELARSLAAHVWDNTASQLRQIDGLGEVAVRKLASASINSIETLLNTEPPRLELVLGKNPPFGHELLKKLESFPNLRVSVKEVGRALKVGKGATIRFVAEVGFLNNIVPQFFKKRPVYVCFLAETSDGTLVDFRRFSTKSLQKDHEVFLTVELTKASVHVNCYVMCDEIAGTCKYAELRLSDIPISIFPSQRPLGSAEDGNSRMLDAGAQIPRASDDDFDDEGINDQDLLSAEADDAKIEVIEDIDDILKAQEKKKRSKPSTQTQRSSLETRPEHGEDNEISIYREPVQLDNGRWTCQHDCNQRNKKCKHKCCREGVTKPRRRTKLEPKVSEEGKTQSKLTVTTMKKPSIKPGADLKTADGSHHQSRKSIVLKTKAWDNVHGKGDQRRDESLHISIPGSQSNTISFTRHDECEERAAKRPRLSKDVDADDLSDNDFYDNTCADNLDSSVVDHCLPSNIKCPSNHTPPQEEVFALPSNDDDLSNFSSEEPEPVDDPGSDDPNATSLEDDIDPTNSVIMALESTVIDHVYADFTTSDVDLGGFEPPLEHVAMSDVHKKSSLDFGYSSTAIPHSLIDGSRIDLDERLSRDTTVFNNFGMENIEINNHSEDAPDPPGKPSLVSCADTPSESIVDTAEAAAVRSIPSVNENSPQEEHVAENEHEREKRVYEEEQRKKWEGIDQWIYDEFHKYVELV